MINNISGFFGNVKDYSSVRTTGKCKETYEFGKVLAGKVKEVNFMEKLSAENHTITKVKSESRGNFLGMTMIPEKGKSITYGMRAMLPDESTPKKPIVQVVSMLGGEKNIYNVEINKVNPKNATQLEMFALLSYTDEVGITDGGSFGSFQQLRNYSLNANYKGYCDDMSGEITFLNKKVDWENILEIMKKEYFEAGIKSQYENAVNMLINLQQQYII